MTSFLEEVTPFVYIIHDRSEWLDPYRKALSELGVPFKELDLRAPHWFDLRKAPPPGIYFNRSSPSSHTRGNRYAMELASAVIDWLDTDYFTPGKPGALSSIKHSLLDGGDPYLCLADFASYAQAHERLDKAYRDKENWAKMAIINTANMGKFTSDRSIRDYVENIWHLEPCTVSP